MNDSQIDALQVILNSESIMSALKQVFADEINDSLPAIQGEDDAVVGQKYRAYCTARMIVGDALRRLQSLKKADASSNIDVRHI